ncbi:pyrimidine-nucleoside phosphorylase [Paenibacillus sp. HB172176]|uniref:pyrimidine-nucleoside phosphorylase n=1 Tax=Paenibacillus sp. HB172176 TaxID=2493690 RepID=UPI00143A7FAD|nr:pyrimidine-nucleoside phosphorylase [Paenibacillus sp. HB172176]
MRAVDLIRKKRDGGELEADEISFLIAGYNSGEIPDYQISAWAMAICFQGMTAEETAALTTAIVESGDQIDLSAIAGIKADKHSTGGVGDKTTLIVAPLVASLGLPVAKMSGRGLGHTGGTLDKLESIPGFRTVLDREAFVRQVNEIGIAVIGQSANLAPADKKLYALRDVTGTVESIPLIASSVMSKKLAAGSDAIMLDVKTGKGAFMKSLGEAEKLAQAMVSIGEQVGRRTAAIISDMNQPLGFAIGNSLEVKEAIETLKGKGPQDLTRLCVALAAHMLMLGGKFECFEEAEKTLMNQLLNGEALSKFKSFVKAQGGDDRIAERPELLPQAPFTMEVRSSSSGFIHAIDAELLGLSAMRLGAGRATKDDAIDYAVGVTLARKVGDEVQAGDVLAIMSLRERSSSAERVAEDIAGSFSIEQSVPNPGALLLSIVTSEGIARL